MDEIQAGAFGEVLNAYPLEDGLECAIKRISKDKDIDPWMQDGNTVLAEVVIMRMASKLMVSSKCMIISRTFNTDTLLWKNWTVP